MDLRSKTRLPKGSTQVYEDESLLDASTHLRGCMRGRKPLHDTACGRSPAWRSAIYKIAQATTVSGRGKPDSWSSVKASVPDKWELGNGSGLRRDNDETEAIGGSQ